MKIIGIDVNKQINLRRLKLKNIIITMIKDIFKLNKYNKHQIIFFLFFINLIMSKKKSI